ncbi:MAG: hypothetical protein FIA94_05815 [Nitrospirae bacterium]|nr:hypothetical protein [Nitrospirota bacterium]
MRSDRSDSRETIFRFEEAVDKPLVPRFFPLLQHGVLIRCRIGRSVAAFLREDIGATAETIDMIQSIILDGKPVDDPGAAFIRDGSTLALSAAMPGLVGATLRRGGTYSSFRSAITYHETGQASLQGEGYVRIKLFNLLMAELGPVVLRKGVFLSGRDVVSFMTGQSPDFWEGCRQITLDGAPVDAAGLRNAPWLSEKDRVFLVVTGG